jgi:PAS domain S-box-containing protein
MRDMDGEPALVLRGLFPRTIYTRGLESRFNILLSFLGTGLCLGLVAAILIARLVAKETERERAEQTLWVRNWALDSALNGVALSDLDGNLTYVNASLVAMWGYREAAELVGRPAVTFWSRPEEAAQVIAALRAAGRWEGDLEALRVDGTTFPAHISATLIRGRDGEPVGMMASFIDTTERKHAVAEITAARQRLEFVVSNVPSVIYTCRPDGDYGATFVSPNLEAQLGYRPEEMTSDPGFWASRIHPEDAQRVFAALPELFTKGHHTHDYRFRHGDGSWRWMHDELKLIRDGSGAPVEILGSWLDITERRRADEERLEFQRRLLHAQKLESLGVLAGGIAHDFNNLLMALLGNIDLALLTLPPQSAERAYLEKSVQAANRAANLTRQMLAYSGRGSFVVERIDLTTLVRESTELFRVSIAKTVTFDCHLPEGLPPIAGDLGQVQQVIMNLITNASESIGESPGAITLATGARDFGAAELAASRVEFVPDPGRFVYLEVADSGCGMDRLTLERLFEPFFTTKFTGRGLGLASVLGIVRGHRGALFVESAVGRGTTVRVLFPAAGDASPGAAAAAAGSAPPERALPGTGWILVVDDEPSVLEVCRSMLESLGWQVLAARDGLQAVEVFRDNAARIACVVLDLSMPGRDGLATLEELRRIRPDVQAILTSGYAEQDATARFMQGDLAGFVQKPYTIEKLRAALGRITTECTIVDTPEAER